MCRGTLTHARRDAETVGGDSFCCFLSVGVAPSLAQLCNGCHRMMANLPHESSVRLAWRNLFPCLPRPLARFFLVVVVACRHRLVNPPLLCIHVRRQTGASPIQIREAASLSVCLSVSGSAWVFTACERGHSICGGCSVVGGADGAVVVVSFRSALPAWGGGGVIDAHRGVDVRVCTGSFGLGRSIEKGWGW